MPSGRCTPGLSWGVRPAEWAAPLPCDGLCPGLRADRAISIAAQPTIVFAWLCQLRVAPYSYDLLDNLGRRSPRTRDPELVHLEVGQRFMALFELQSFVDDEWITLRSRGVAVTYAVRPEGAGSRLHARVVFGGPRLFAHVVAVGDLVMMRKQLLTLRSLAEREAAIGRVIGGWSSRRRPVRHAVVITPRPTRIPDTPRSAARPCRRCRR